MSDASVLAPLRKRLQGMSVTRHIGRLTEIKAGALRIKGLSQVAQLGDEVRLGQGAARAEITSVDATGVTAMPFEQVNGMALGTAATLMGPARIAPSDAWLGRVIDPFGNPLDGRPLPPGPEACALDRPAPAAHARRDMGVRLHSGIAVLDTMLPVARGQRLGLFAGSGVGKSTLLGQLAQQLEADVVVIAMIGERGREVRTFLDKTLGPEGLARAVVVAATSDMAAGLRRRALPVATTIAEYFRDQGKHVLLLADSITRFAEAHREVAAATGEAIAMRGYPASLTPALAQICERAGTGADTAGDITALFSVLVAGSDMEEPVADILRGLLDGHVVLSRSIAEAGRFPAVDVLRSVSRCLPDAATPAENDTLKQARALLGAYQSAELMIQSGLYTKGGDPMIDRAIAAVPKLNALFTETRQPDIAHSFAHLAEAIGSAPS